MASYSKNRENTSKRRKSKKSRISRENGPVESEKKIVIKPGHLWLFRIIAVTILPVIFLVLLEILLTLFHVGYDPDFIIPCQVDGKKGYTNNPYFAWRFFPKHLARQADPFFIPAEKPANTYRIFVMGASAAQGTPDGAFSFSRVLKARLEKAYPKIRFEVINTAMVAINSHVVRIIADECTKLEPDLFIVYLGNNEVVGPYGAGTILSGFSDNLKTIRFGIWLKSTRIGQLVTEIANITAGRGSKKAWTGMQMFLDQQVRQTDPRMESVYEFYRENLSDICSAAGDKTNVLLCTVGSNLKDCPGFASLHKEGISDDQLIRWQDHYTKGVEFELQGEYSQALAEFTEAERIDNEFSDLLFRIGRCYEEKENSEQAHDYYVKSRDTDALRFRADTRINEIIRQVVSELKEQNIILADIEQVLNENTIPGYEMFYEHVHYNFKGNTFLADQCMNSIDKILSKKTQRSENKDMDILLEDELQYNIWVKFQNNKTVLEEFIQKPPFTNQLYHDRQVEYYQGKIDEYKKLLVPKLMEELVDNYIKAINRNPEDLWHRLKYAELMEDAGNIQEIASQQRWIVKRFPLFADSRAKLGLAEAQLGNLDESIKHNRMAIKLSPGHTFACFNLALAYQLKKDTENAFKYYGKAMKLNPEYAEVYNNYAGLLYQQGEIEKAIEMYEKGLSNVPDSVQLLLNLGLTYKKQLQYSKAREYLKKVLELEPDNVIAKKELKSLVF